MGTVLKYIFYAVLLVVFYLVGRGVYDGWQAEENAPEVVEVVEQVQETASSGNNNGTTTVIKNPAFAGLFILCFLGFVLQILNQVINAAGSCFNISRIFVAGGDG